MFTFYKGLNMAQIEHMKTALPYLKHAEAVTKVPWEILAGIWFRESFSMACPKTPGGQMQFDPPPTFYEMENWLYHYTHLTTDAILEIIRKGINDFQSALIIAGCFLQHKTAGALHPGCSDAIAMHAIWRYNGCVQKDATHSSYVYNGFDKIHYPMKIVGSIPDGNGGRKQINTYDYRPGAYVIYKQLKEIIL